MDGLMVIMHHEARRSLIPISIKFWPSQAFHFSVLLLPKKFRHFFDKQQAVAGVRYVRDSS